MNRKNHITLSDAIKFDLICVSLDNGATHQYSISAQLHVIDPTVDTLEVGHHIINGQPLVLYFRVVKGSDGKTSYELLDAGYAKK